MRNRKYDSRTMRKPVNKPEKTASAASSFAPAASAQTLPGFTHSRAQFEELADAAMSHARKLGASDVAADVSESAGLSVSARQGELETVEHSLDKSLAVTVYIGHKSGSASTCDFSPQAVRQTVQAAYDIARYITEDPASGLPDEADVAGPQAASLDLDLFHPWNPSVEQALALALACEQAALQTSPHISNSEGAGVSAQQSHFFSAHSHGFRGGYASSRHSFSVSVIAGQGDAMQRDGWFSAERNAARLASPEAVGRYAAERALSRVGARKISTRECPVLFEAPLAAGLLGHFVQAVSGGALYRKNTFLAGSLGQPVFAGHVEITENPFIPGGRGSAPFDGEGVRVTPRQVVQAGHVAGYFLGSYSARKLGMKTTGNAGGSHNLRLYSRQTSAQNDLPAMLQKLGTGLFVTELMGSGVNYVTGDYSRGASGYWVENGQIAHPVQEVTIAGNLREMFLNLQAIGADAYTYGAKTSGSVLIARMKVAGS